ncbi:V-type proton ATPase 116 kDa subunit a 1-like [Oppia nitens]|uniref:V-type proton ATPase 116 kDa subunit a 1-like n=1 Tax=Oppia nitens TaxID=1686743 RepID=UPI0023DBC9D9|nr:V-type proton ATPase 116 kDa subunit a 1-like [Oppia nitens]
MDDKQKIYPKLSAGSSGGGPGAGGNHEPTDLSGNNGQRPNQLQSPFSVPHDEDIIKSPAKGASKLRNPIPEVAWIRSEPMALCQLVIQRESAYACVDQFGQIGRTEFRDLNATVNAFQRTFVNELRRCDEMERQLLYFEREIRKDSIPVLEYENEPPALQVKEMSQFEAKFEKIETELMAVINSAADLKKNYLEFTELRHILKKTGQFFEEAQEVESTRKEIRRVSIVDPRMMRRFSRQMSNAGMNAPEINIPLDPVTDINFIAGTILRQKFQSFQQMLWRVCRGNIFLRQVDIEERLEDPKTGEMHTKCIFIIVFQGEQLKGKCKKICEGFHTTLYPCPEIPSEREDMHAGVVNRMDDLEIVMKGTDDHRRRILVAVAKNIQEWRIQVRKMKCNYETLNKFSIDISSKCLVAECWCPEISIGDVQGALITGQRLSQTAIPSVLQKVATKETPPTFNITNRFTTGFQAIVDAYGVGNYGEVNPMPYTIVTFPFIFAVMFGDAGHGLIMALFALWMVLKERSLARSNIGEIGGMFFDGRYIILLMGLFSIYSGFIYNDCFSKAMNIFGSQYFIPDWAAEKWCHGRNDTRCFNDKDRSLDPQTETKPDSLAYPLGMDPIWQLAENRIVFLNTYKMKTSVILGVLQMLFGVLLSIINHIHFRRYVNIVCEFIPQVLFLMCIFGYMNFMIFFKWFTSNSSNSNCAPNVLITLINMFMFKQPEDTDPCYLKVPMYNGQNLVQTILIVVALLCVPWMLFIKPIYLRSKHNRRFKKVVSVPNLSRSRTSIEMTTTTNHGGIESNEIKVTMEPAGSSGSNGADGDGGGHGGHGSDDDVFDFGDAFIHQAIHTIEYCLGSISHTASYLRLWALSLAHAELSEVLWNMLFINGFMEILEPGSVAGYIVTGIIMWVVFAAWAVLTVAILLLMEGLSAFLHALRLHWVEFQSKFYDGSGYLFQPYSYRQIVQQLIHPSD